MNLVICIGNTDNKLSQQNWSEFIKEVDEAIRGVYADIHFAGGSNPAAPWQNYSWIIELSGDRMVSTVKSISLMNDLIAIRTRYHQNAVWVMDGKGFML